LHSIDAEDFRRGGGSNLPEGMVLAWITFYFLRTGKVVNP
jgi:hypothetical protein